MRYFAGLMFVILLSGCATWKGVKEDANSAADWTKEKVNKGAGYIEEKTSD